jgi:ADP-ribose pyrophosphatase YjhB (NUDIX family)
MPPRRPRIRPIALAVIRRGPELLLETAFDTVKAEHFARPPGGGIEFGERASDAARREIQEEFGLTFVGPRLLAVLENIFMHEGSPGHEVVFVFEGELAERWAYDVPTLRGTENRREFEASWVQPGEVLARGWKLHPDGFPELLRLEAAKSPPVSGPAT